MVENAEDGFGLLEEEELVNEISDELSKHPAVVALLKTNQCFILTDPTMPGNPIVYASQGFLDLTGYPVHRVLGRNCRFLQGPGTDPLVVAKIRQAVDKGEDVSARLLNYRRNGSTFWNHLVITVIHDGSGNVVNFLGVQCEIFPSEAL